MRVLVKYAMAVLFVALISENGVLGQDSTRSAQLQNFDYEEWMKDVPMPSHTIFSIFCIDFSYCRWSRAIRDCKLGKPHYKISDPHHQENLAKHICNYDKCAVHKSRRKCNKCRYKMVTIYYQNFYDEKYEYMKGGSYYCCPKCMDREAIMFVN
jgi:hypothetical protein